MRRHATHFAVKRRGSVLVPVIAAMLLLSLCGGALAEVFGAQRSQSVLSVESARAFWIAEAGAWHAAYVGTDLTAPVAFAGGSYTVTSSGTIYRSTGVQGSARRDATATLLPPGSGGGSGGGGGGGPLVDPIDESATINTVSRKGKDKIEFDLVTASGYPVILASFSLSANSATTPVDKVKLDNKDVWKIRNGVALPTGTLALNDGDPDERMIEPGTDPELRIEFKGKPRGTITYTLVLSFTNGTSSTLVCPIRG